MSDPSYVRLPTRLNVSIVADFEYGSGWSIAGLDVKPVPDADEWPEASQFVADMLRRGHLEPASKGEYDLIQKCNKDIAEAASFDALAGESLNEASVQDAARKARRAILRNQPVEEEVSEAVDFGKLDRDGLVALANSAYNLNLPPNTSKADALKAVQAAADSVSA